MAREIRLPDIGDFKDVPVIEILVKSGDRVDAGGTFHGCPPLPPYASRRCDTKAEQADAIYDVGQGQQGFRSRA